MRNFLVILRFKLTTQEYLSDAFRNTVGVIIPLALFISFGNIEAATGAAVGALLISLTDLPDHSSGKNLTAMVSLISFFVTSLIITATLFDPFLSACLVLFSVMTLSLLSGYGSRMSTISTVTIVLITFILGAKPENPLTFSLYIFAGGFWYFSISLIQIFFRPYRSLQSALSQCIAESEAYLKAKAKNYDLAQKYDEQHKEAILSHLKLNGTHESIRSLLLNDSKAMDPDNLIGNALLVKAMNLIDLHEQISSLNYDYAFIREKFKHGNILSGIAALILNLAMDLKHLRLATSIHLRSKNDYEVYAIFLNSKNAILEELAMRPQNQQIIVKDLLVNIENIAVMIKNIKFGERPNSEKLVERQILYDKFVNNTTPSLSNLTAIRSRSMRFALRLTISFVLLYLLIFLLGNNPYGYWGFLTLTVVARPGFALTKKRNLQRIKGTVFGLAVFLIISELVPSLTFVCILIPIALFGSFAFNRLNYTMSAFFATLTITLTLFIQNGQIDEIMLNRFIYTIAGCFVSISAIYFFPIWDRPILEETIKKTAAASSVYFQAALNKYDKTPQTNPTSARMARKNANVELFLLSQIIENVIVEPAGKKLDTKLLYSIVSDLYKLNSVITSIFIHPQSAINIDKHITKSSKVLYYLSFANDNTIPSNYSSTNEPCDFESTIKHKFDYLFELSKQLSFSYYQLTKNS